eukprot:PhF_6_TR26694/c0_g1_i3/m.38924
MRSIVVIICLMLSLRLDSYSITVTNSNELRSLLRSAPQGINATLSSNFTQGDDVGDATNPYVVNGSVVRVTCEEANSGVIPLSGVFEVTRGTVLELMDCTLYGRLKFLRAATPEPPEEVEDGHEAVVLPELLSAVILMRNVNVSCVSPVLYEYPAMVEILNIAATIINCSFGPSLQTCMVFRHDYFIVGQDRDQFEPITVESSVFEGCESTSLLGLHDEAFWSGGLGISYAYGQIRNTSFKNNSARRGGALFMEGCNVTIEHSLFEGMSASDYGGSLFSQESNLIILNAVFLDSVAHMTGGSIYVTGGSIAVIRSVFRRSSLTSRSDYANGGAIYLLQAISNITKTRFHSCRAPHSGGGCYVNKGKESYFDNLNFENCSSGDGGAVSFTETVTGQHILQNVYTNECHVSDYGGAVYISGHVKLLNVTMVNSYSGTRGGSLYLAVSEGMNEFKSVTFRNGYAQSDGGCLYAEELRGGSVQSQLVVSDTIFQNCTSMGNGGGLHVLRMNVTVRNSTFRMNRATSGGGASLQSLGVWVVSTTCTQCSASLYGGCLNVEAPEKAQYTEIMNSAFSDSTSGSMGGAVYYYGHEIVVVGTKFLRSSTRQYGGCLYTDADTARVDTSYFEHCVSEFQAGGMYFMASSYLTNSALYQCEANFGGGVALYVGCNFQMHNTTITESTATIFGGAIHADTSTIYIDTST